MSENPQTTVSENHPRDYWCAYYNIWFKDPVPGPDPQRMELGAQIGVVFDLEPSNGEQEPPEDVLEEFEQIEICLLGGLDKNSLTLEVTTGTPTKVMLYDLTLLGEPTGVTVLVLDDDVFRAPNQAAAEELTFGGWSIEDVDDRYFKQISSRTWHNHGPRLPGPAQTLPSQPARPRTGLERTDLITTTHRLDPAAPGVAFRRLTQTGKQGPWHCAQAGQHQALCGVHIPKDPTAVERDPLADISDYLDVSRLWWSHCKICWRRSSRISYSTIHALIPWEEQALTRPTYTPLIESQDQPKPYTHVHTSTRMSVVHYMTTGLNLPQRMRALRETVPPAIRTYENSGLAHKIEEVFGDSIHVISNA